MPNDTAPAQWDGLQAGDQLSMIVKAVKPWGHGLWMVETVGGSAIVISQEDIATPSEVDQRTLAASAAAWIAAREAAAQAADGVDTSHCSEEEEDAANFAVGDAITAIRALPPPSDAAAALAEVVRVARDEAYKQGFCEGYEDGEAAAAMAALAEVVRVAKREAFEEAARLVETHQEWNAGSAFGVQPKDDGAVNGRAYAAAIRARSTEDGA
jgi:hypothetical protein